MKNDPYEAFKADFLKNIRQTITWQRAKGISVMSVEELMQVTPIPKENIGPVGTNARWIYRQMFEDVIAPLPRAYRAFVQHNESAPRRGVSGLRDDADH